MNSPAPLKLAAVNAMDRDAFVSVFGSLFEDSPWVAGQTFDSRPFASIDDLFATLCATVKNAGHEKQLSLLCAHPELGVGKKLTPASEKEQTAVGLTATGMEAGASRRHIATLNQQYREKFGFPFIIAVKGHSIESIMDNLERRLSKPKNTEFNACLEEVYHIAQFRLQAVFGAAD